MPVQFIMRIRKLRPVGMKMRQFNDIVRDAAEQDVAPYWIANFLPMHFEPSAVQRYSYAARRERYTRAKRRFGVDRPLVWSERLRKELLGRPAAAFNASARSTSKKCSLKIPLRYGNVHRMQAAQADELRRLVARETAELRIIWINGIRRRLAAGREQETTVVK